MHPNRGKCTSILPNLCRICREPSSQCNRFKEDCPPVAFQGYAHFYAPFTAMTLTHTVQSLPVRCASPLQLFQATILCDSHDGSAHERLRMQRYLSGSQIDPEIERARPHSHSFRHRVVISHFDPLHRLRTGECSSSGYAEWVLTE